MRRGVDGEHGTLANVIGRHKGGEGSATHRAMMSNEASVANGVLNQTTAHAKGAEMQKTTDLFENNHFLFIFVSFYRTRSEQNRTRNSNLRSPK